MERRAGLKSPLNTILGANPVSLMQNIAEQNMDSWKAKNSKLEEKESNSTIGSH